MSNAHETQDNVGAAVWGINAQYVKLKNLRFML